VESEPTDEELRAFVAALLSNLDKLLREPEVIEEAIAAHREMWVGLYRTSSEFDAPG
jgi:hypothetical protein